MRMQEAKLIPIPTNNPASFIELHTATHQVLSSHAPISYPCAPVTSAVTEAQKKLSVADRILENKTQLLTHMSRLIAGNVLPIHSVFLPANVGQREKMLDGTKVPWRESDYLKYVIASMLGLRAEDAEVFAQALTLSPADEAVMGDYYADVEQRKKYYDQFAHMIISVARSLPINPAQLLIFPGYEVSLGCGVEEIVAKELGIKRHYVSYTEDVIRVVERQ